jgi:hypothetical protein
VTKIDADGERGALRFVVLGDHQRQLERIRAGLGDRHAHDAARVPQHERQRLRADLLGGDDEVSLIFSRGVVGHDHEPSGA